MEKRKGRLVHPWEPEHGSRRPKEEEDSEGQQAFLMAKLLKEPKILCPSGPFFCI
jgi:hypothetical protein